MNWNSEAIGDRWDEAKSVYIIYEQHVDDIVDVRASIHLWIWAINSSQIWALFYVLLWSYWNWNKIISLKCASGTTEECGNTPVTKMDKDISLSHHALKMKY